MHYEKRHSKHGLLARLAADRRANFAVMTALGAPFAIALCAVAVDQGSLFNERRSAQSLTDIAAITAAANIDSAEAAVLTTLNDNGIANAEVENGDGVLTKADKTLVAVNRGHYDPAATLGSRFTPGGAEPYNAVRVSMRKLGSLYFGSALMTPPAIGTTAIASVSTQAAFSVGSGLVAIDTSQSPILNAVLGGLLGTSLALKAVDYQALASANVNALQFVDALATQLDVTAGTYDEVLAAKASVGDIAHAVAAVPGLDGTSKALVETIAGKASAGTRIKLGELIDLGPIGHLGVGAGSGKPQVQANVLELLTAAAALANGDRQADIDLGVNIPKLASVSLRIAVGEPAQHSAWLALGEKGTMVRTAQIRVRLLITIGGVEALAGKLVTLPIYVDIAPAEGRLAAISCSAGRPTVGIDTTPGVADLRISDIGAAAMRDFSRAPEMKPVKLVDVSPLGLGLVSVSGQARAALESTSPTRLSFSSAEIESLAVKTASSEKLAGSLTASLFGSLQLEAKALGIKVGVPDGVTKALGKMLGSVAGSVDDVLDPLLKLLGVKVGYADVRVTGAICRRSVLVQ